MSEDRAQYVTSTPSPSGSISTETRIAWYNRATEAAERLRRLATSIAFNHDGSEDGTIMASLEEVAASLQTLALAMTTAPSAPPREISPEDLHPGDLVRISKHSHHHSGCVGHVIDIDMADGTMYLVRNKHGKCWCTRDELRMEVEA
jgi:hypothetical protein